ncbi:hypothetical protein ACA910_010843 [Epithemia clementina (nom. ined.)]
MSYYGGPSYRPPSSASSVPPTNSTNASGTTGAYYGAGGSGGISAPPSTAPNYSMDQWHQPSQSANHQQQQQQQAPHYNQWQPHQAAQQQQQSFSSPSYPQQQQQQQPQTTGWDPSMAAVMAASAAALGGGSGNQFPSQMAGQLATDMTKSFLRESWIKIIPGLEAFLVTLRTYFAVDNKYVLQKIKTILFPFLKKEWNRNIKGYGGPDGMTPLHDLPIADENAPDLYVPFMSLITYVLLCALVYGNAGKFNPEVIPDVTTKCFVTQILEVLFIRVGLYLVISAQPQQQQQQQQYPQLIKVVAWLDLLSYSGYKYLGLSINMFLGLMAKHFSLGARVFYITFLWTASAASYFMYRTMKSSVLESTTATNSYAPTLGRNGTTNQEILVLVFAVAQFATMWFVSQTKFL